MNCTNSLSFAPEFSISSKTVSCAKKGTSYQVLPSLSVHDITSITFGTDNTTLLYFSAAPNENVSLFTSPLTALTLFFNKYFVGTLALVSNIETVVGSKELENLKFTSSKNLNVLPVDSERTLELPFTVRA